MPGAGSTAGGGPTTRGGSDTSLENNNVYGLEPKVYVEGSPAAAGKAAAMGLGEGGLRLASVTAATISPCVGLCLQQALVLAGS